MENKSTMKIGCYAFNAIPKTIEVEKEIVKFILKNSGGRVIPLRFTEIKDKDGNDFVGLIQPKERTIGIIIEQPVPIWEYLELMTLKFFVDDANQIHFTLALRDELEKQENEKEK